MKCKVKISCPNCGHNTYAPLEGEAALIKVDNENDQKTINLSKFAAVEAWSCNGCGYVVLFSRGMQT